MNPKTYVYVANAADQVISRYELDEESNQLTWLGEIAAELRVMPLVASPDKRYLYASIRSEPFHIVTYRIDPKSGDLCAIGKAITPYSLANLDLDKTGRFLFGCSYGDHLITVSPILHNGTVGEIQQTLHTGRNAHAIHSSPDNRFVFSSCLGDDQIMQYCFDEVTGKLTPNDPPSIKAPVGSGSRHFVFSTNGKYVYVLGETTGSVATYTFDSATGLLNFVDESQGLPLQEYENIDTYKGRKIWTTDIHASPDGRFLYLSEVVKNIVTVLSIDSKNGLPSYQGYIEVEDHPRGFNLTQNGRYMLVAGNNDSNLGLYKLGKKTGLPTKICQVPTAKGANWVEMVEF